MIVFNVGSKNKGGTLEQATINAKKWLANIHLQGFLDVEMIYDSQDIDGDFLFNFIHPVTKKSAQLSIHGFSEDECEKFTFRPRIYWNGSYTAVPEISDWAAEGFKHKIVYYEHN